MNHQLDLPVDLETCVRLEIILLLYTCHLMMVSWIKVAEGKTLLTSRHSLNAFSESRPIRTLELMDASKADCQFDVLWYSQI